ncbi:formyltransferase [Pectinatus frisingensis]|jgi:methionyl-tRNA formyltransferase|uniref:formyltransferase n=1 Tax=Pectinatus frisingensis TaxID=865 RepID=UPI0018C53DAA|nr:formyltransferase [Pectinatus frisingensis]
MISKQTESRPSIALFAYSQPGFACLSELIKIGANVSAVFTHIDADDEEIWFDSVYDLAKKNNIPVYRSKKIDESARKFFYQAAPDIILSAYYRAMIPDEFLSVPRLGAYNLHGSLLPRYRGRACINWAVLKGETRTGVTLHVMTEKADRGDIVAQKAFDIKMTDTAHDVFLKTSLAVKKIIKEYLPLIEAAKAPRFRQDESQATKFGRRHPADGIIDWNDSAAAVYNLIRSVTHPFPGAFTFYRQQKLFIWWAVPLTEDFSDQLAVSLPKNLQNYSAGTIVRSKEHVIVKCGQDSLLLHTIAWAGEADNIPTDKTFIDVFKTGNRFDWEN